MSMVKIPLSQSVLDATYDRIAWTLDNFSRTCVSFSGGKDSTVMLHLTAQMARARGKKIGHDANLVLLYTSPFG